MPQIARSIKRYNNNEIKEDVLGIAERKYNEGTSLFRRILLLSRSFY